MLALFAIVLSISVIGATTTSAQDGRMSLAERSKGHKLKVVNKCKFPVWMEQQQISGAPRIVMIRRNKSHTYNIDSAGDASTRIWAKTGCDRKGADKGQNCNVGQTIKPCPDGGCQPAIDSLLEATWACVGPGCDVKSAKTFYDTSQVDGYTYPFKIKAKGSVPNNACLNVNCAASSVSTCPTDEDLSSDGAFPEYAHEDLRYKSIKTGEFVGCMSPCEKMTAGTVDGGYAFRASDPQAILYCCPSFNDKPAKTKKVRDACLAGPVPDTEYVNNVHTYCGSRAYAWAYDDVNGNHACQGITTLVMKLCPKFKKKPTPADL